MFDSLLGSKFSNKCKHCVKCLNSRIPLIRKKKQANVDFLKKVIADLLAHGRDDTAFHRIEPLIIEINYISCYDMIEQYCQYILKQLPYLQKQRECPEEAMEAVATLIFAAARFSDLPELSDLRQVFVERYGSHMEKSVNAEFVDKTKKSFSEDKKLQFMQAVADEFSVQWDFSSFKHKTSKPPASDQPKRQTGNNTRRSVTEMYGRNMEVVEKKEAAVYSEGGVDYASKAAAFNKVGAVYDVKGEVGRKEPAFHVNSVIDRKKAAAFDVAIDRKKAAAFNEDAAANRKKEGVFNGDAAVNRRRHSFLNAGGGEQEVSPKERCELPPKIFMQKQVRPEPREIAAAVEKTETLEPHHTKGSLNEGTARNRSAIKSVFPYNTLKGSGNGSNVVHLDHVHNEVRKDEGPNPTAQERRPTINQTNPDDAKPLNMAPPYTKPNIRSPSPVASDIKLAAGDRERSNAEEKPQPVSVRRRHSQLQVATEADTGQIKEDSHTNIDLYVHQRKGAESTKDEVSHDQHVRLMPSSQGRRHGARRSAATYDGDRDEDEQVMDRLLSHYSKKGVRESSKMRTRTRVPAPDDLAVDAGIDNGRRIDQRHQPERVASLPVKSKSPIVESGISVGHIRANSLHPDMLSPNGGGARPRIPDYDDLAAQFIALKKA